MTSFRRPSIIHFRPHARIRDGEIRVWQVREEGEDETDMLVIMLATIGNLQHLGRAETWYVDGNI